MSLRQDGTGVKRWGSVVAAVLLAFAIGAPAHAEEPGHDAYAGLAAVQEADLREMRGGMTLMGVEFSFGAVHKVLVDGTEVARTAFTFDGDALVRTVEFLDETKAQAFTGANAPNGINLGGLSDLPGFVVPGGNGKGSLALADINPGAFEAALLNNAADQNISHKFDAWLAIHNFAELQASLGAAADMAGIVGTLNDLPHF